MLFYWYRQILKVMLQLLPFYKEYVNIVYILVLHEKMFSEISSAKIAEITIF